MLLQDWKLPPNSLVACLMINMGSECVQNLLQVELGSLLPQNTSFLPVLQLFRSPWMVVQLMNLRLMERQLLRLPQKIYQIQKSLSLMQFILELWERLLNQAQAS